MKAVACLLLVFVVLSVQGKLLGGDPEKTVLAKDVPNTQLCTPDQWEGVTVSWYPELDTLAFANVSYDFTNKMLALDVEKWHWSDKDDKCDSKKYSMLFRFDKKKAYFFHDREDGKNCTVKDLEHEFMEFCVPDNAKCVGSMTIGGKLDINGYRFIIEDDNHLKADNDTWVYYEATPAGLPVSAKYGNKKTDGVSDWYDLTTGIEDPHRFDPPDFCDDSTSYPAHRGKRSVGFNLWHLPFRV